MHLIYAPIYAYWIFLSIRARAFFFFSGANPGIFLGGLFMESKMDIYARIPDKWIPKTAYLPVGADLNTALQEMQSSSSYLSTDRQTRQRRERILGRNYSG